MKYGEIVLSVNESYKSFRNDKELSKEDAIAATLEELIYLMKESNKNYTVSLITLCIISIKNDFIPSYLENRINDIKKLDNLDQDEIKEYQSDLVILKDYISKEENKKFADRFNGLFEQII